MSFYGQVVYEFTKMFSQFDITPSSNSETPITPLIGDTDPVELQATAQWERIQIEPSNRWIQLRGEKDNDKKKLIKIGHGTTGEADNDKTTASLTSVQESDVPMDGDNNLQFTQLTNGNYLKIPTCKYDAAGHFIDDGEDKNPEYTYYKLPTATINIGINGDNEPIDITPDTNDKLVFNGDDHWIILNGTDGNLNINHTLPQYDEVEQKYPDNVEIMNIESIAQRYPSAKVSVLQGKNAFLNAITDEQQKIIMEEYFNSNEGKDITNETTIYALAPGDLIKTNIITKDQQGHILKQEPIYYRLPVPAGEAQFHEHEGRIIVLENKLASGSFKDPTDDTKDIAYGSYEDIVKQVIYYTGQVQDIYDPNKTNVKSIVETIGNIDSDTNSVLSALKGLLGERASKDCYTISEAIQLLSQSLKEKENTIITLENSIAGLSSRIDALEGK